MPDITISLTDTENKALEYVRSQFKTGLTTPSLIVHVLQKTRSSKSSSNIATRMASLSPQARTHRSHKPSTSQSSIQQPTYKQQPRQQQPQWASGE